MNPSPTGRGAGRSTKPAPMRPHSRCDRRTAIGSLITTGALGLGGILASQAAAADVFVFGDKSHAPLRNKMSDFSIRPSVPMTAGALIRVQNGNGIILSDFEIDGGYCGVSIDDLSLQSGVHIRDFLIWLFAGSGVIANIALDNCVTSFNHGNGLAVQPGTRVNGLQVRGGIYQGCAISRLMLAWWARSARLPMWRGTCRTGESSWRMAPATHTSSPTTAAFGTAPGASVTADPERTRRFQETSRQLESQ
jgi:hypothetical protein